MALGVKIGNLMRLRLIYLFVVVALVLGAGPVLAPHAFSNQAFAANVSQVVIRGTQRVEDETILSYMQLGAGDSFDGALSSPASVAASASVTSRADLPK